MHMSTRTTVAVERATRDRLRAIARMCPYMPLDKVISALADAFESLPPNRQAKYLTAQTDPEPARSCL